MTSIRDLLRRPGLGLAIGVYLLLALSYFFIVPIFEAPDEWTHTGHIKYIAEGNGLPVMLPGRGIWGGQQPPLYYSLGALLVQPFELEAFDGYAERTRNPHASLGYALDPGNKNNYLHQPSENFPYRGLSLTVHVLRLYSMLLGLVGLIFIYLTAYDLFAGQPGSVSSARWFAAAVALLVACQPMYAFITASVANEPANIATSAAAVWLAQRYVLFGPTTRWRRAVALGILLGLVALSKMTGLSVGLVAVVAILQTAIATRKQPGAARLLWRDGLIIGTMFLLVAGWWYWRNYQLYGDFFQQGLYKIYFNVDPQPLTLNDFLYTLSTGEVSFWATFGWLNIVAPDWVYSIYRIVSRVGLLGVAMAVGLALLRRLADSQQPTGKNAGASGQMSVTRSTFPFWPTVREGLSDFRQKTEVGLRQSRPALLLIHIVFPVALAFSLTRLVATEGGLQGRQLLPALGSAAIVIIWGWWALTPARLRLPVLGVLFAVLLGLAVWLPFGVVAQEYTPPPLLTEAELPSDLVRLNWTYNDDMRLLGVSIGTDVVRPGQRVPVTAYWQALRPMATDYSVFVHLIGRNYNNVGQFNTYPGLGLRPTSSLQPGQIVADIYPVLVNGGSQAPSRLLVNIGLFDIRDPTRSGIPAVAPDSNPVPPTVGRLKLIPVEWPAVPEKPPLVEFADNIRLADYNLDDCKVASTHCILALTWLAQETPSADYTVFIQLWHDDRQIDGFDGPPLSGDYPTSLWAAGEVIVDPHLLELSAVPAGTYNLQVGLYNFATGERLFATANGEPLANHAVELGRITVKK